MLSLIINEDNYHIYLVKDGIILCDAYEYPAIYYDNNVAFVAFSEFYKNVLPPDKINKIMVLSTYYETKLSTVLNEPFSNKV